ncbi:hypothetical protein BC833DRAFT_613719 [Globomyces pollinis-pini]|nr:hypothetical protein BC833DRAFT_613719 [Globomyces pollinis-pini]
MQKDTEVQSLLDKFNDEFMAYQQMGGAVLPSIALSTKDLCATQTFSDPVCKKQTKEMFNVHMNNSIDTSTETLCDEIPVGTSNTYQINSSKLVKAQSVPNLQNYGSSDAVKRANFCSVQSWFCPDISCESDDVDSFYGENVACKPTPITKDENHQKDISSSDSSLLIPEEYRVVNIQGTIVHVRDLSEDLLQYVC